MRLNQDQLKQLKGNDNVIRCSPKSITYNPKFKLKTVKKYFDQGKSARQIFEEAGFDLSIFRKKFADDRLRAWRKIYKEKGEAGLLSEKRGKSSNGGRTKMKGLTDKEKIERLELTIAYQKEKIDFLARLRAKRKE